MAPWFSSLSLPIVLSPRRSDSRFAVHAGIEFDRSLADSPRRNELVPNDAVRGDRVVGDPVGEDVEGDTRFESSNRVPQTKMDSVAEAPVVLRVAF